MDKSIFWKLITHIDLVALSDGDENSAVKPLIPELASLSIPEIESFQEHLAKYLYDIDGKVYAKNAGLSGHSDDAFLYCRCFVVAQGEMVYEAVKSDPSSMPKTVEEWFEPLLYAASEAWAKVTGNDPLDWEFMPSYDYETGSNTDNWN